MENERLTGLSGVVFAWRIMRAVGDDSISLDMGSRFIQAAGLSSWQIHVAGWGRFFIVHARPWIVLSLAVGGAIGYIVYGTMAR